MRVPSKECTSSEITARITPGKVRDYTNTVREWLGTNPTSREPHLPHADKAPATKLRGVNVYQVDEGLLVDLHLFLRLRKRGQARGGAAGVAARAGGEPVSSRRGSSRTACRPAW